MGSRRWVQRSGLRQEVYSFYIPRSTDLFSQKRSARSRSVSSKYEDRFLGEFHDFGCERAAFLLWSLKMRLFALLLLMLLAGCGRPAQVQTITRLVIIQPEWRGASGTAPIDATVWDFCKMVEATIESPSYSRGVLRSDPTLDASVSQVDVRRRGIMVEVVVTARDQATALEAGRVLAEAMVALTDDETQKKYSVRVRAIERPTVITR